MKKNRIWAAALTVCAALVLSAAPPTPPMPIDAAEIEKLSKNAKSSAEHKEVAGHYNTRAEFFEAKAKQHEKEVERLRNSRNYNPMASKWPALANGPVEYHKRAAMQALRAAEESRRMAETHLDKASSSRTAE